MNSQTILLTALVLLQGCQFQTFSHDIANTMNSASTSTQLNEIVPLKSVTLIARQEAQLPDSETDSPDRPLSFASIFLTLENPSDRIQTLELLQVEVIAVDNDSTQLSSNEAQTIKLMPLENAVLDIQLNNRERYGTEGAVKAIATYRINDTIHSTESPVVEIR